jgi:hypothetical protein
MPANGRTRFEALMQNVRDIADLDHAGHAQSI